MNKKNLTKILSEALLIGTLSSNYALANSGLTTNSTINQDNTNVITYNNTGSTIDELSYDLSNLIPGTYSLQLGGGGWNETGDQSDQIHTYAPIFSSLNLDHGENVMLNIQYDQQKLLNDYGIDVSTLPTQNYSDNVMGEEEGGTQYNADATLRNFEPAPECNDGIDNDGNGLTDIDDFYGCTDANDTEEYSNPTNVPISPYAVGGLGLLLLGAGSYSSRLKKRIK